MSRRRFPTLYPFRAQTENQQKVFDLYADGYNLSITGSAGTGKTALSICLGLQCVKSGDVRKVVILRNNQSVDDVGHLPGDYSQKLEVHAAPYNPIIEQLFMGKTNFEFLSECGYIEFSGISFLRGQTFDHCAIVVEESQNMTFQQLDTTITRVGKESRIIFNGDTKQTDNKNSGWGRFKDILDRMPSFRNVEMGVDDIVRSGIVKEYLISKELQGDRSN